ncbi:MAG: single-stranded DNA-binding protein [Parvimonas sp.]|nr:single-stranded DNA-binding protein [Parvimonas sp.]
MNNVILTGRIAKDLEIRYTQTGKAYCRLTLAVDRGMSKEKKQEAEAKGQPTADFINCVVWNKLAETINKYSGKGRKILVEGSIQTGSFTAEDGSKKYTTDILVNRAEILEFANNNTTEDTQPFGQFDLPYEEANNEELPF